MNVLIVGAGALGQVFGHHLAKGGAAVSYLVKPGQVAQARRGFRLYRLEKAHRPVAETFAPRSIYGAIHEVAGRRWDAVWLCVQSTALGERWLGELRDAVGISTIVSIGQDIRDRSTLARFWSKTQIVFVTPSLFAYHAPLPGEQIQEPGVAYWVPPKSTLEVCGQPSRVASVVDSLGRGGMAAKDGGLEGKGDATAALMMPYIAAAEVAGWSLHALGARLVLASDAAKEASAVVASLRGDRKPSWLVTSPLTARLMLWLFPRLAPFDLEGYLRAHFTKVSGQTRQMMEGWISEGHGRGLKVSRLEALRDALAKTPTVA